MVSITKRNRRLENEDEVFSQNAWDDTEWTNEMIEDAEKRIKIQKEESLKLSDLPCIESIESRVSGKWNDFYKIHADKFFKDRQWIFSEFPEILAILEEDCPAKNVKLFEVGCGVGNAIAHIVENNKNPNLHLYCCDLSQNAIDSLKQRDFYKNSANPIIDAIVSDISQDFDKVAKVIDEPECIDFIMMIFTLSALRPEHMQDTVRNLATLLKPGGMILFRDYARYDLTQLRFKGKSYLSENYYVRADGTTSFFFTQDYIHTLFSQAGLHKVELKCDNRLLVNRSKELKMCRCWIQAKYRKPSLST